MTTQSSRENLLRWLGGPGGFREIWTVEGSRNWRRANVGRCDIYTSVNYFRFICHDIRRNTAFADDIGVKLIVARTVIAGMAAISATYQPLTARHHFKVLRSLYFGGIHLARKLFNNDALEILSRFRTSISDELSAATIAGHYRLVRTLNLCSGRALTARYPNYVNKYATDYLTKSLNKATRRAILQFHHEYLASRVTDTFYDAVLNGRLVLWSSTVDANEYVIRMTFDPSYHSEGDSL